MITPAAIGIDVGSTSFKAVAIDKGGRILKSLVEPTNPHVEEQTRRALDVFREALASNAETPTGATGYGRKRVQGTRVVTEITCHAKGAFFRQRQPLLLIDVGGQDTKVIKVGAQGEVLDFAMNDKCAAGTGRFLEVILARLCVPMDQVATQVTAAQRAVTVSSTCTVFAESEVVSLVAQGEPLAGILKGLHQSLALRVTALASRFVTDTPVYLSGGVALNTAMVDALSRSLGRQISVLPEPQLTGALGAALAVCAAP
jgi:(R)-2-hydroxyacyl-CoA dehydratese activating ATPase